jgi:hypothetical protein
MANSAAFIVAKIISFDESLALTLATRVKSGRGDEPRARSLAVR